MRFSILALFLILPLAFSWVYPHQSSYSVDPYERVRLCATVYSESNTSVTLTCGENLVGERNALARVPTILCFDYAPVSSVVCYWDDGTGRVPVRVDVFPHRIFDAVLAVLLVVLIVRFTVRLVKVYL